MPARKFARWCDCARTAALAITVAACASLPPTANVTIPPLPAVTARAWFYRGDDPDLGLGRPYVRMNGAVVGVSEPGGAFYRDVAPGEYDITVDSWGTDINQFPHVVLRAGETAYFKVLDAPVWASGAASANWARPTYYVWRIPPPVALPQVAQSRFYAAAN
jgi:hypothetical protein